jgi:DNA-binding winged helix-turn-helix (wHTH) protein/tetratricopeptide (TPR) repeat protein
MNLQPEMNWIVRFDVFELNLRLGQLRERGVLRRLPPQPFRVLVLMVEREGQTVTRRDIHHCLWGDRKYVDSESGINFCISQVRSALRDPAGSSRFIKTAPRTGYRFVATTAWVRDVTSRHAENNAPNGAPAAVVWNTTPEAVGLKPAATSTPLQFWRRGILPLSVVVLMVLPSRDATVGAGPLLPRTMRNSIVVEDFDNTTKDTVFDDTLKLALTIAMRQSPLFKVLSDAEARRALKMMTQPENSRMTGDLARILCLRTNSSALLEGRIASLGAHYVLSINAVACNDGELLMSEQEEIAGKEDILAALNRSASRMRIGLGESLRSVQKFDVNVDATTNSLEALKSYSTGIRVSRSQGDAPSMPFFRRAIELDPGFSLAYAALATAYNNLGQPSQALPYATKAFELRDTGTELERLVSTTRYLRMKGQVEKLTQTAEIWKTEYPRDANPYTNLGANYAYMGQYSKAAAEFRETVRLQPDVVIHYDNLASIYVAMNRPDQALAIVNSALTRQLDGGGLRWTMYHLAFLQRDAVQMNRQLEWAAGKPGSEDILLSLQSDTEAYFGHLDRARGLSNRAVDSANRSGFKEAAALWEVVAALREAEFGNVDQSHGRSEDGSRQKRGDARRACLCSSR